MAMKLLAVLAIAGGVAHAETPRLLRDGAPAAGNTMGKGAPDPADEAPREVIAAPLTPAETVAVRVLGARLGTLLAMFTSGEPAAVPRTINGRPACGNVASRAPRRQDCP